MGVCIFELMGLGLNVSNYWVCCRYEKGYMDEVKLKSAEKVKEAEGKEITLGETSSKATVEVSNQKSNNSKSSASELDLDRFLLGDLEDSDNGPGTLKTLVNALIKVDLGQFCFLL